MKLLVFVAILSLVLSSNVDQDNRPKNDVLEPLSMTSGDAGHNTNATQINSKYTAEDCYRSVDEMCPTNIPCNDLDADCLQCDFDFKCIYGDKDLPVTCKPKPHVNCTGSQSVTRKYHCRYCYQLEPSHYFCNASTTCSLLKPRNYYPARPFYTAVCKTNATEYCLGHRCFYKQRKCNWI